MKRFLLILLFALSLVSLLGAQELVFLHEGDSYFKDWPASKEYADGFVSIWQKVLFNFEKTHPGVKVRPIQSDLSAGSSMTLDTMLASGQPPDVVIRTGALVAKLLVDSYAIQPDKYVSVADFTTSGLDAGRKNGKLYALPMAVSVSTMAVNLDHLAKVGYTLPPAANWTTDAYLTLGKALKEKGLYLTSLFAKNQSSDHWWMNWFMAFGAKIWTNGDYTKTTLNSPQAMAALKYLKQLVDLGYVPPNPGEIDDDMALDFWCKDQVTTLSMQIGHTVIMQTYAKQGTIAKEFKFDFVEFPHAVGAPRTPVIAGPTLVVGHKQKTEKLNKVVAELMLAVSSGDAQLISGISGNFPTSKKTLAMIKDPNVYWSTVNKIIGEVGIWDRGNTIPQFGEIRAVMFPLMQAFYAGKMSAEDVLKNYEAQVNKILKS